MISVSSVRGSRKHSGASDGGRDAGGVQALESVGIHCGARLVRPIGRSSTTMSEATPISVRDAFAGKHVLLTGAAGFLGKVWLALMLDRTPELLDRLHRGELMGRAVIVF